MSAEFHIETKYLACCEDPRMTPGFPGEAYPAERDGAGPAPENVKQAKDRFQAVYARRNACVRALLHLRPGDAGRRPVAREILFLTEAIDHLEDVYAQIGFIAEPIMDDTMFTRELVFTHAPLAGTRGQRFESSFSIYIPIPAEAPRTQEGPDGS